jgi:hypothetical protein
LVNLAVIGALEVQHPPVIWKSGAQIAIFKREPLPRDGERMTTRDQERLDRIVERYSARLPGWMARFIEWVRKPELRLLRIIAGIMLVLCGFVGFLPILGFWMVPLGLLLLAQDITFLRRPVVNAIYWCERKWQSWRRKRSS